MKHFVRLSLVACLSLALPVVSFAAASDVADAFGGLSGNGSVSRSAFLKAAIITLGIPVDFTAPAKQYRVYAEDIRPYVVAAAAKGAFDAFGDAPDLAMPVSRGEAIRLIAELRNWKDVTVQASFSDVPADGDLRAAVELSIVHGWMAPLRGKTFGVAGVLKAKDARTVLTRAASDADERSTTTVTSSKKHKPVDYLSKKFRDQIVSLLRDEYLYAEKLQSATGSTADQFVDSIKDPYTTLFDPKEAKAFQDQLSGELTGIGVQLDDKDIEVLAVIEGSPAERAGMKPGDVIVSVNKKRVVGKTLAEVVKRIRGAMGTPVRVGVERNGEELSFDMIRAKIEVPDTKVTTRNNVAIVTVSQFGNHLMQDGHGLFAKIAEEGVDGIVIDLRDNPGGYLNAVPSIVGEFLPRESTYLHTRSRTRTEKYVTNTDPSIPEDLPVVILVNGNTASSAEIVAGALQDHRRATIVGTKTFGKGTVQTVYPFMTKSTLKFTIAEWLTPDEHLINTVGITPDEVVEKGDAGDVQLDRALDIIREAR